MPRLIYCPFTGCCPLRIVAYTNTVASRLINIYIIPFVREVFSINIDYDGLVGELFQIINEYCERELENIKRIFNRMDIVVVKACDALPRISESVNVDKYRDTIFVSLKKIPIMCSDELPNTHVKYRINYRFSEAAARTLLIYSAIYIIYRIKGVEPVINGEHIVDIFSKQLSNTWRSKMKLIPIVINDVELYLDWNKKDFIAQLKKLLINIAKQKAVSQR
uniref:Uncharacterized protein n=1 Tax=Ignisphaera aggregans TaxID=334771 RepID=A0A7J3I9K7_9CREN